MKFVVLFMALTSLVVNLRADEFHLDENTIIRGVLIGQVDGRFKIRVENGTIELPMTSVVKHISDDLTVRELNARAEQARPALEEANALRMAMQADERAEAAERRQRAAAKEALRKAARRIRTHIPRFKYTTRYNPTLRRSERYIIRSCSPGFRQGYGRMNCRTERINIRWR